MKTPFWRLSAAVAASVCLTGAALAAGRPDRPAPAGPAYTAATRTPGTARPVGPTSVAGGTLVTRATTVLGTAWTADNAPIKQARLRLRNIISGKAQATTLADDAGQFTFENVPGGSYVVELLSSTGHIEVVGHVFTIGPGETVATFVRTRTRVPWFTGFFNNSVAAIASTAASQGVTAIAPVARPVSPNR